MLWIPANDHDDEELTELMKLAARALEEEDKRLARALDAVRISSNKHAAIVKSGVGLSYWLYETTIVYLIWRAWIEGGHVAAWDWTGKDLLAILGEAGRFGGGERRDLVTFGREGGEPARVFEAKWWTHDGALTSIKLDFVRLETFEPFRDAKRYMLLFWHDKSGLTRQEWQDKFGSDSPHHRKNVTFCGEARFHAQRRENNTNLDGDFILAVFQVQPI